MGISLGSSRQDIAALGGQIYQAERNSRPYKVHVRRLKPAGDREMAGDREQFQDPGELSWMPAPLMPITSHFWHTIT